MSANQAGWVVVPREPVQEQVVAARCGGLADEQIAAIYRDMLAASPRYEPGDAVEAAYQAWDHCDSPSKLVAMRAALTAAFPELLARVEALEAALLDCARQAEALKRPCGESPESAQAIRNGQYQNISTTAHIALGTIRGPMAELERARKEVV